MLFRSKRNQTKAALPPLDPATSRGMEQLKALRAESERIGAALDTACAVARSTTTELEGARANLAEIEAAAALAGSPVDAKARKAVITFRDALESIEARCTGLEAKARINADAIAKTETALSESLERWRTGVLEQFAAEYLEAAGVFKAALEKFAAVSVNRGAKHFHVELRHANLPGPKGENLLADAVRSWKSNPEAVALNRELLAIINVVCGVEPVVSEPVPLPEPTEDEAWTAEQAKRDAALNKRADRWRMNVAEPSDRPSVHLASDTPSERPTDRYFSWAINKEQPR